MLVGFFVLLAVFAATAGKNGGILQNASSTPETSGGSPNQVISQGPSATSPTYGTPEQEPELSDYEIEQRLQNLYYELDRLTEEVRAAKLREPISPYAGLVTLGSGDTYTSDPGREYLMLYANGSNRSDVNISDWYLESLVTERRAAIPQGARILERERSTRDTDIFLRPGEQAYLMTGSSPLNVSFHENMCTGYLATKYEFYPWINQNCPEPESEMARFARIALDNDACYDYVESLYRCQIVDEDTLEDAGISRACQLFVRDELTYDGCVENHRSDPFFDDSGYWWIYLDRDSELWREKREIIRLMDENDRVIDVIEY